MEERSWYRFCHEYLAAAPAVRREVSRQTLAHYRKIKKLPACLGEDLDAMCAPFFVIRWIAWATEPPQRLVRYAVAIEYRERAARWPPWRELSTLGAGPAPGADVARFRDILAQAVELTKLAGGKKQ